MIDGIINNGPKEVEKNATKQEETRSKKPSVLVKLRQYQAEDKKEKRCSNVRKGIYDELHKR